MTTGTGTGGSGSGSGGGSGTGPVRLLRAVGDYTALWLAIGRMTGELFADVVHEIRAQHRLIKNGGVR